MNENELLQKLTDCILDDASILSEDVSSLRTFEEAGLLTSNKGLVLRTKDGREFQITIAQRR